MNLIHEIGHATLVRDRVCDKILPIGRPVALFSLMLAGQALAQDGSVDWYRVAGGGGASANGSITIAGTIGQAEAGFMSVNNSTVQGGFWGVASGPPPQRNLITWTNVLKGNWSVAGNWSPNQVPGPADDVSIGLNGDVTVDTAATVWSLTLIDQCKIGGPGTLTLRGPLNWLCGWIRGTVQCNGGVLGVGDKSYGSTKMLDGGRLINTGSLTNDAPPGGVLYTGNGSVISNAVGATFDWNPDRSWGLFPNSAPGTFYNAGLFRKSGGTSFINIPDNFINTGMVELKSGSIYFMQPYVQNAGVTSLLEGQMHAQQGFALNGGLLTGTNSLTGNLTNSATISPGNRSGFPGQMIVYGSYTQTGAGTLAIELGGTTFTANDRFTVNGAASLAGTLNVSLINGFLPPPNSTYSFLTVTSRQGTFQTVNFPPNDSLLAINYTQTGASLSQRSNLQVMTPASQRNNPVTVAWPATSRTVRLETSTSLTGPWSPLDTSLFQNDGQTISYSELPATAGNKFFRLQMP